MAAGDEGKRQLHLGVFTLATGHHADGWRMPGALTRADDFPALLSIARIAERAKLDFVFFADAPSSAPEGPPGFMLNLEPMTLLAALAVCTSHIGLVATVSSTFTEPYNLARYVASVDRISKGRAGWNVVTTSDMPSAANFGRELPPHDTRYEIADEYLRVVQGLWDSWEDGAVIADAETGQYLDRTKRHAIDHAGTHFTVKGPLSIARSPQGRAVIVQAGSSAAGQAFAAKYAEIVFTVQQDIGEAEQFYRGLKERAAAASRPPDHLKIMPGIFPVVGRTEAEAREKYAMFRRYIRPGAALAAMSQRLGHDVSGYPMDAPFPQLPDSRTGTQTYARVMYAKAQREGLTLRDIHDLFAMSRGYLLAVGSPRQVADVMEEWLRRRACDGFMLTPAYFPGELEIFCDLVVPELHRRGLFRADYAGTTLRSHLGLPVPKNRFATKPSC
jgi:FMN-dependent oxidoreductase (nitrilotriacetate monooxygenase family)